MNERAPHSATDVFDEPVANVRSGPSPPRWTLLTIVSISVALALVFVPFTLINGTSPASHRGVFEASASVLLLNYVSVGLLFGALGLALGVAGLLLRRAWGWWTAVVFLAFFVLIDLRLAAPLSRLNWDHPRAAAVAWGIGLQWILPLLLAGVALALLLRPSMRAAYGLAQQPYVRRRSAGRLRVGQPRSE